VVWVLSGLVSKWYDRLPGKVIILYLVWLGYVTDPAWAVTQLQQARKASATPHPQRLTVGIGFITWHLLKLEHWPQILDATLDQQPAALWLSFGDASPIFDWLRYRNKHTGPVFVQVSSVAEARQAVTWGAHVIVAQGNPNTQIYIYIYILT
jgi:NAD(P)H-dependent flavin oxidoreductase YrpB (nitropropane dioxygenase family)